MMDNRLSRTGWLLGVLCCLMAGGCVDAAREGLTGGVQAGVSGIVQALFDQVVDGAAEERSR